MHLPYFHNGEMGETEVMVALAELSENNSVRPEGGNILGNDRVRSKVENFFFKR